jgi:hypothetical protein
MYSDSAVVNVIKRGCNQSSNKPVILVTRTTLHVTILLLEKWVHHLKFLFCYDLQFFGRLEILCISVRTVVFSGMTPFSLADTNLWDYVAAEVFRVCNKMQRAINYFSLYSCISWNIPFIEEYKIRGFHRCGGSHCCLLNYDIV